MPKPRVRALISHRYLLDIIDYDKRTGNMVWRSDRSRTAKAGDLVGTVRRDGNVVCTIDGKQYLANRLAWFYVYGEMPRQRLIAKNGDRGDLRWSNIDTEDFRWKDTPGALYARTYRRKKKLLTDYGPRRAEDAPDTLNEVPEGFDPRVRRKRF